MGAARRPAQGVLLAGLALAAVLSGPASAQGRDPAGIDRGWVMDIMREPVYVQWF